MTGSQDARGHVVVAVDGTAEGYSAAVYAARRAAEVDAPVDVVHVIPAYLPMGATYPVGPVLTPTTEEFENHGEDVLVRARRVVVEQAPHVPLRACLLTGGRVREITGYADSARLLVLGRREHSRLDQVWTGGTIAGVASRASCPVVVVPAEWSPASGRPRIVAGFKGPQHAAELFAAAFSEAEQCGADLLVLHAWKLAGVYDDIIADRVSDSSANREQKEMIRRLLADYHDAYAGVGVRIEVTHETPVHALVRASHGADRLVMVRPAHGSLVHHLGRTARGVLRESHCPVQVVATARPRELPMPPVVLEEHGGLAR